MTRISVFDLFGENALTGDQGSSLYTLISASLNAPESVVLDFAGVRISCSSFMCAAIGPLYGSFSLDTLNELFKVENAEEHIAHLIGEVVKLSRVYYGIEDKA